MRRLYRIIPWVAGVLLISGIWLALGWLPQGRDSAHAPVTTALSWMPTLSPTATPLVRSDLVRSLPTVIPTPTATLVLPTVTPTPPPLSSELLVIAEQNGFDTTGDFIVISQNTQRMHIVKEGVEIRTLPVTTGDPEQGSRTPEWKGVIGKYWGTFLGRGNVYADQGWWLFLGPGGNFLIHGLPYVVKDGEKAYKDAEILGLYPASSGCIRLSVEDITWFTEELLPEGMPIVILPFDGGSTREG